MKPILDMTAGSRMFWWDKDNPNVVFLDKRRETYPVIYHNRGRDPYQTAITVDPDVVCDWEHEPLPYADNTFSMVVYDPPHLIKAGDNSWLAKKYGKLDKDRWSQTLKRGFQEGMRVLKPQGTLVFKWNDDQIPLAEVLKEIPYTPLFGDKRSKTHWLIFMKEDEGNAQGL